jgi:hypothetical protein
MTAAMTRAIVPACLFAVLASNADAADQRAQPDRVQPPTANSCAERISEADEALWRAYRSCVVQADQSRITGNARGDFIIGCTTRRSAAGDANEHDWTLERSCYAKAATSHPADRQGRALVDDCLASERARGMTRLAEWSTGVHRPESW